MAKNKMSAECFSILLQAVCQSNTHAFMRSSTTPIKHILWLAIKEAAALVIRFL